MYQLEQQVLTFYSKTPNKETGLVYDYLKELIEKNKIEPVPHENSGTPKIFRDNDSGLYLSYSCDDLLNTIDVCLTSRREDGIEDLCVLSYDKKLFSERSHFLSNFLRVGFEQFSQFHPEMSTDFELVKEVKEVWKKIAKIDTAVLCID